MWNWAWPHWKSWSVPINLTELAGSIKPRKLGIYKALISDSTGSTQSLKTSYNNKLNNMMFEKCFLTGLHSPENNRASGWTCCLWGKWWLTRHWKRAGEINGPLLLHWKGLIVNRTAPGIPGKVPHPSLYFSSVSNTKSKKKKIKSAVIPKVVSCNSCTGSFPQSRIQLGSSRILFQFYLWKNLGTGEVK